MVTYLIACLVLAAVVVRAMTADERRRALVRILALPGPLAREVVRRRAAVQPFFTTLRARMRWPLVTPALVILNATMVLAMFSRGDLSGNPEALVSWGASVATRTTGGEWWRLATALFVHAGWLHLLVGIAALWQAGLLVERLVGRAATAAVYVSAGIAASIVSLAGDPMAARLGASGAVFGLYGVLIACAVAGLTRLSLVRIPLAAFVWLAPVAPVFSLFNAVTGYMTVRAELTGLAIGLAGGIIVSWHLTESVPSWRRAALILTAPALVAIVSVDSFQHVMDVRPEMREVLALEERTSEAYSATVDRFRKGRIPVEDLIAMIEHEIVPEVQARQARVGLLTGVPLQDQPLVDAAREYLRLREESWRLRAEGLRSNDQHTLSRAEHTRVLGLNVLQRVMPDQG